MEKIKKSIIKNNSSTIFIFVMLALPLIQFLIFTVFVNANTFIMAFQTRGETGQAVFSITANFNKLIINLKHTTVWKQAILNSLGYFPVSSLICLPLSVIAAYFISKKIVGAKAFSVIFFIPSIVSIVVTILIFKNMFDSNNGVIPSILEKIFKVDKFNIPDFIYDPKYAMCTLYLYAIWAGIGNNVILLYGAISRVPVDISEAASIDGCGVFREIFSIYVPIIWQTISTLLMFGVATIFTMFLHTQVMTNGIGNTETIAFLIVSKLKGNMVDYYYVSFLSVLLILISVPIVQVSKRLFDKVYEPVEV